MTILTFFSSFFACSVVLWILLLLLHWRKVASAFYHLVGLYGGRGGGGLREEVLCAVCSIVKRPRDLYHFSIHTHECVLIPSSCTVCHSPLAAGPWDGGMYLRRERQRSILRTEDCCRPVLPILDGKGPTWQGSGFGMSAEIKCSGRHRPARNFSTARRSARQRTGKRTAPQYFMVVCNKIKFKGLFNFAQSRAGCFKINTAMQKGEAGWGGFVEPFAL
jgi:hypothetical protein